MISFGGKIPIAKCKIQNRETGKFENATVYEYTCTDESDIEKIKRITSRHDWQYGFDIFNDARWKKFRLDGNKNYTPYDIRYAHFYSVENSHRKTIGLCETMENQDFSVELLETQKDKPYRFVGQTILATLGQKSIESNNPLIIKNASSQALDFYRKTCGFTNETKKGRNISFIVDKPQMQEFIEQTEQRTNGEIVFLKA